MANDTLEFEAVPSKPEMEFEFVPVPSKTSRRLTPSTTSTNRVDLDLDLDLGGFEFTPTGEEILQTDDELYERIESDMTYKPTDAELDKFLDYKSKQPKYALDLIKGVWNGGKAVVGDLAKGVWGAVKDPELMLSPTPTGMLKRGATLAEGAARATWDLGTVGRYINDWFGEQGDREYREEIEDMKLRQSNPDWKMKGAMGGESYLSKEQKEAMRTSWATSYIKARIKEDLNTLSENTNNFKDPDLKRDFNRSGLKFVDGETRDFYTSPEYINNVLSPKQRDKYYEEFPKWINKRRRDRWRRGRYLMRTTELARRGETTVLGELFGPKVDEAAKAFVNSDVATLASYAGGPAEAGAVLSTKLARKSATSPSALAGKATEKAGKGTQWAGGKVKQFGEWVSENPNRAMAAGAGVGYVEDLIGGKGVLGSVEGAAYGGAAAFTGGKLGVLPKAGELLQKGGAAVEAIGEVIAKPEGVEGLLKAASRVAKDEGVAETFNKLSRMDPAINLASDLGKGAAVGSAFGGALTLPSGDPEVIGSGIGAGGVGGFFAAAPGRYLTKGPRLKEQLQNEWSEFQKQLTPEQLKNIKEYAPTLEEMGNVITTLRMVNGVTRGGGNIDFKILSPTDFAKSHGVQRGVVVTKNKTRPSIEINAGYKGPNSLYHEAWHALKRFAGETEIQKTPDGKQEVAVLKPHLEQIQSILFGKKLEGKTVTEGLFKEKDLIGGFYDQYTSKMAPEERAAFQKQFELGEDGKKLTPAEADQKKLNYMMEEVEAESFRYLMSNTNPRQIAQGNRSLHQKFIDHMLLSEHSKTLRGMRKALETVGIDFKPSGQPSDIFMQKGQGITNSRELNAALRQYLRAWEGMQHRTRVMGDLEPSGFSIGGTGKAGRAQVEYHLSKKENDFLRDHFSSSDMLKKNKDGGVYYDPDGRVILLTEGEIKKLQENRSEQIREKLSETDDGTGMVMMENGSFEGIPSPHQLDAIDRISNEIITPNQKQIIRETAEIMRNDPGAPIQFLYNAALGKGKTYSSSLSSTHRTAVPLGFHISKAQNFYFTSLDLGAYHRKISAWGDPTKKALHKGGHKLALWDKDVRAFEADLFNYLDNHKHGRKGAEGLDPNAQKAEQKRNVLNDFFDINRNKEADGNFNPVTAARRAIDPKTGKQKKRAYRGLESLIRSYRLDRVLDENFGKSFSYALGKAIPMKSGAAFHEGQRKNLMPAPSEGAFNKAKEAFGTTKDTLEAGYVLPDGEMLDFSGRHEGSPERDIKGQRYSDHREISQIGTEMTPFVDLGAIRIDARSGLIELGKEPTASQLSVIKRIVEDRGSEVHFDLRDSSRPDYQPDRPIGQSLQPEAGTDPKRVVGMIRRFYRGDDISGAAGRFMPAPTFYSKAERAVEGAKGGVFDKKGMTTTDKAISLFVKEKKGDKQWQVPEAEVEWSGVVDWLEGRKEEAAEMSGRTIKEDIASVEESIAFLEEEISTGKVIDPFGQLEPKDLGPIRKASNERAIAAYSKDLAKLKRIEAQGHKVSKAELLEFLQNKGVKVEEVARGGGDQPLKLLNEYVDQELASHDIKKNEDGTYSFFDQEGEGVYAWEFPEFVSLPDSDKRKYGIRKWSNPDAAKEDFRKVLYEQSSELGELAIRERLSTRDYSGSNSPTLFQPGESDWVMLPGDEKAQQSYGELVLTLPEDRAKSSETFELPSSHRFPESNILAHIRFTERVDADGKKMLFIEELQSDWSNTGRRDGWKQERPAEAQKEIVKLSEEMMDIRKKRSQLTGEDYYQYRKRTEKVFDSNLDRIEEIKKKYPVNPSGAPDMPFKGDNRYGALAMKRMIRWASDNGFDRLGWITGKDTAERYNLSKHVDVVKYYPQTKRLIADKGERGTHYHQRVLDKSGITPEQLEAHLGKDVAKKLLDSPLEEPTSIPEGSVRSYEFKDHLVHTLAGDDLAIGGEWATTLYDKVLPTQAKKIVKKKGAVGRTEINAGNKNQKVRVQYDTERNYERKRGRFTEYNVYVEKVSAGGEAKRFEDAPTYRILYQSEGKEAGQVTVMRNDGRPMGEVVIHRSENVAEGESFSLRKRLRESEKIIEADTAKRLNRKRKEANYVDITPEVKALAEEGFSYFMPPGGGKGRAAAPAQPVTSLPATPVMPKVKLTDEEKEDSRRLLNLLKEKGI